MSDHQDNYMACGIPKEVTEAARAGNAVVMEDFHHLSLSLTCTDWASITSRCDIHKKFQNAVSGSFLEELAREPARGSGVPSLLPVYQAQPPRL